MAIWAQSWSARAAGTTHKKYYERALENFRQLCDFHNEALILSDLGAVLFDKGDWPRSFELYEQSLHIFQQLGKKSNETDV